MAKKPKFKPVITRVKLNPEQAVLACACYSTGKTYISYVGDRYTSYCDAGRTYRAYVCKATFGVAST
jgi:hypothetical protein